MHIENVIFLILSKIAYTKFSEVPSGEIRTPGILNPKAQVFIFLNFYAPFSDVYSGNSSFPELSTPLFPGVRILSIVKNVVKPRFCSRTGA